MKESHLQFQKVFDELYALEVPEKIKYLECLLFYFTIAGRALWSDDISTDSEKVLAFKWLNELTHRIWNLKDSLQQGESQDTATRLYDNMKFYSEQSNLLRMHLVPTTISAFENYLGRR